ncbi:hypothetical protein [Mucilaginibacter humi]|uniref:hypothetical protein n=1 Tax=Mucilaginibacter humi TaxID=2732510 RepID=UPI00293BEEA3|nr:hypothetical protein [Mucilaginibacter humi]
MVNVTGNHIIHKPISQTHCVIGNQAYSSSHHHKTGLLLLNNLLGGMGMSNRLNRRSARSMALPTLSNQIIPR